MTMTIKILGTGCRNCVTLDRVTREAVMALALDASLGKVEDYQAIMDYSVMTTPRWSSTTRSSSPGASRPRPRCATSSPTPRPPDQPRATPTRRKGTPPMIIKILGSGCANCVRLEANTKQALAALGLQATVEKVTDFADIASYGVMRTPGLVVDEQVLVSGRVPDAKEITALLSPVA